MLSRFCARCSRITSYPDVYLARRLVQWIGGMEATDHEEEPAVANKMDWSMQKPQS